MKNIFRAACLLLITLSVLAGSYFHVLDSYELPTLDLRFRLRPHIPTTDKVALIEIGDDTIARIGRFPFDRSYHAALVKALSEAGAKAIVFDLFFSEPQKSDAEFEEAVKKAGNVYFPLVFELEGKNASGLQCARVQAAENLKEFATSAKGLGHINVVPDIDGKYRRVPAYIRYKDSAYPYLPLKLACDYLGISQDKVKIVPGRYIDLGAGIRVPLDEHSLMLVNFSGGWGKSYKHYSYVDILQSYLADKIGEKPNVNLADLKDKVCIVGLTALGTVDLHPTPFDSLYPAVGMHAETFNSIVQNKFVMRLSRAANLAILIALCVLVAVSVLLTKPLRGAFILFSVIALYVLGCMLIFNAYGVWVDMLYPLLVVAVLHITVTLYKYVREWKTRLIMENELGIAKKIQESFLPKQMPSVPGIEVSVAMFTARQVGGDLYDFVAFDDGRLGVMIGDVSGKGVPAALFMAMAVGSFRSLAVPAAITSDVLANLNTKLVKETVSNLFVTMFYMVFDMKTGEVGYGNGGHLPVLYLPKDGAAQFLDVKEGAPLGLMDGAYSNDKIKFYKGDTFILYTDGVTEAMNARSDMYGKERLEAVAVKNRLLDPRQLVDAIEKDVRKFEPKNQQHDDITILVVKII